MNSRRLIPAKPTNPFEAKVEFRRFVEEIERFRNAAAKLRPEKPITCVADMPRPQGKSRIKPENARALLAVHRQRKFRLLTGGKTA